MANEERLARAPALDLASVTLSPLEAAQVAGLAPDDKALAELTPAVGKGATLRPAAIGVDRVRLGMLDDRPVYRFGSSRRPGAFSSGQIVFADTGEVLTHVGRAEAESIAPSLRPGIRRPVPLRRLPHRARPVDAAGPRADADASLRARRCGRHAVVRVVGHRRGRAAHDLERALLGIPGTGHPLGLLHAATQARIGLAGVHHLVVAPRLRDVPHRPGLGRLALLSDSAVPSADARCPGAVAVRRPDEVASLCRPVFGVITFTWTYSGLLSVRRSTGFSLRASRASSARCSRAGRCASTA